MARLAAWYVRVLIPLFHILKFSGDGVHVWGASSGYAAGRRGVGDVDMGPISLLLAVWGLVAYVSQIESSASARASPSEGYPAGKLSDTLLMVSILDII